jgi:membrane protein involved in colicin uptake
MRPPKTAAATILTSNSHEDSASGSSAGWETSTATYDVENVSTFEQERQQRQDADRAQRFEQNDELQAVAKLKREHPGEYDKVPALVKARLGYYERDKRAHERSSR